MISQAAPDSDAPLVHGQLGTDTLHGSVRMGVGPLNTEEHIEKALAAVREIAATYPRTMARSAA